jgi:hypothetical protein
MLSAAAAAQEQLCPKQVASTDIWNDAAALHMLQHGEMPEGTTAADRSRIVKRLSYHQWQQGKLLRRMPDGSCKQVPHPEGEDSNCATAAQPLWALWSEAHCCHCAQLFLVAWPAG